jgi:hypothetical protein
MLHLVAELLLQVVAMVVLVVQVAALRVFPLVELHCYQERKETTVLTEEYLAAGVAAAVKAEQVYLVLLILVALVERLKQTQLLEYLLIIQVAVVALDLILVALVEAA